MKVLVVGNGGREHALVWKLAQSPRVTQLFCAPGNPGIDALAHCPPLATNDVAGLRRFAEHEGMDLTVIGPEVPLALGIADEFRKAKLKVFGPTRAAARIESSKAFSKELMLRHRIPTPSARTFDRVAPALEYLEHQTFPVVVKADGLAQGKGVIIAQTREEAAQACLAMLEAGRFGEAGRQIVIEQFLHGEEATVMAFTDGQTVVPMLAAQDHKRLHDGDAGPNTGGMGAYAPAPLVTPALMEKVVKEILLPTVEALARLGSPYQGVLYAGLMIVRGQPYVLEYNARFGDPETQVILPLLDGDLVTVLEAVVEHRLDQVSVAWRRDAAVCVVLTSDGYPGRSELGHPIHGLEGAAADVMLFHAGTTRQNQAIVTAGGRVLGVTATGPRLAAARERAYHAVRRISFQGCHYRSDIARRAGETATE